MEPKVPAAAFDSNVLEEDSPAGSESDSTDMAAMMGFSTFGSKPKPPSKKRKLDHVAASEAGTELGSGSNSMPLGKPRGQSQVTGSEPRQSDAQDKKEGGTDFHSTPLLGEERLSVEHTNGDVKKPDHSQQLPTGGMDHEAKVQVGIRQGEYDWSALRRGIKDEKGDMAYYDASFVEDPWKHLTD